jgi:hypothetical protein
MVNAPDPTPRAAASSTLRPLVRLLLWDYDRGSLAYEIALVLVFLLIFLVPGAYWGDPLWVVR